MFDKRRYKIIGAFDTETTNMPTENGWRAFPVLHIFIDVESVDIDRASYDALTHRVRFFRHTDEWFSHLVKLAAKPRGYIPVICAYNLMFDLQPIIGMLSERYDMRVTAQTSTNIYTLDLMRGDTVLLRFWDVFHLETVGLYAMGEVANVPKLTGSWNYDLMRTPETPLTSDEIRYASHDVIIIIMYLQYLRTIHDFIEPGDLGFRIITKSSIVRRLAASRIGQVKVPTTHGKRKLEWLFGKLCEQEKPPDFDSYALRKTCFRGGLTFTAARYASTIRHSVHSLDVTSMHHAHINGMRLPVRFFNAPVEDCQRVAESVASTRLEWVLKHFEQPFWFAFHMRIEFTGLRLKSGSVFERDGIAIIPRAKFKIQTQSDYTYHEGQFQLERSLKMSGWKDRAENPTFAFGKLYRADRCILHLTEYELWSIAQVYEWDSMTAIFGECTAATQIPPDYITLQSQHLYRLKSDVKRAIKEGKDYNGMSGNDLNRYYNGSVKGMYNSIYGTQAMDLYRPDFTVEDGTVAVDCETIVNADTFEEREPRKQTVLYTYGMRIVGRSRMHLVIAMMLLSDVGNILGGDTDSIKLETHAGKSEILCALQPLHKATTRAIDMVTERTLGNPYHSEMPGLGLFEVETDEPYTHHMELWPKARISYDGRFHVTCAGLSQVEGMRNITDVLDDVATDKGIESAFDVMGYNTNISFDIAHSLQHYRPKPNDRIRENITDHTGTAAHVIEPESIALYPAWRMIGDTTKRANMENVEFMRSEYSRDVRTEYHEITKEGVIYGLL